jgi:hypothetical protein
MGIGAGLSKRAIQPKVFMETASKGLALDDRAEDDQTMIARAALSLSFPLFDPSDLCLQGRNSLLQGGLFLLVRFAHRARLPSGWMSVLLNA